MRLLQKECGKCLRHPFLWIVCIAFGLFQFLSIYTYVGNAGMRKELRQLLPIWLQERLSEKVWKG